MAYGKAVYSAKEAKELSMVQVENITSSRTGSWLGTNDLDAFDSDCDEAPGAKEILMANLSSYDSDVISENKESFQTNKSCSNLDALALNKFFVINDLKAQLQAKESSISKLRAHIATLKGKNMSDNNEPNNASVITPGMLRLDLEPLSHRLKNNREAHEDYLQKTKEHTDILRRLVERARKQILSDPYLDYAGVIASTSVNGSQYKNNTRKNRITPTASSNKKNKVVEVHPRKVMSSSNKRNHVSMCNANFKHAIKDANSKTFTINGTKCPMTGTTTNPIVPLKESISKPPVITLNPDVKVYRMRTKVAKSLINFVEKILGTIRFGNDHIAKIMGYGGYQIGNTISHVYYVEGLGHNLFSLGINLLTYSRDTNLYTFSLSDMMRSSPISLLSKASKTKSLLWHRRLSHLNFITINKLSKQGLVRGLPKLKYKKYHMCEACSLGKSKKHADKPKFEDSIQEKLYLLHMDLCGPMRIKSINGKKYILVIVDDYSQFT
uniref:GAG-pre-integrase domain-containing protein n=1 Tax=Tanacetum cinerariifolium TaxID=118510 RepID=A0A6L2JGT4_TANCI|nr:hypothetical protein [Tanacetum cinerariifolium]